MFAKNHQRNAVQIIKEIITTTTHQDLPINDEDYELLYRRWIESSM